MNFNVSVSVRIRPPNVNQNAIAQETTKLLTNNGLQLVNQPNKIISEKYYFDKIYDKNSKQEHVFNDIGKPVVDNTTLGFNSCIFAYGQTGCFARGTKIQLFHGGARPIEKICLDDAILGDDSTPRIIMKLFKGMQNMYHVYNSRGDKIYTVNEDHVMVFLTENEQRDKTTENEQRDKTTENEQRDKTTENEAYSENEARFVEMTLKDYIALRAEEQQKYYCMTAAAEYVHRYLPHDPFNYAQQYDPQNEVPSDYIYNSTYQRHEFIRGLKLNDKFNTCIKSLHPTLLVLFNSLNYDLVLYEDTYIAEQRKPFRITYEFLGLDRYYGFTLTDNHRFLGEDFQVLRNSGKTHCMFGDANNSGLIPRIARELQLAPNSRLEMSYYEIYQEKIYDLCNKRDPLSVRQHPTLGPYVDGLSQILVKDYAAIETIINEGNLQRKTASTQMNHYSSRSHAVITFYFSQLFIDTGKEVTSKINLVDLAGSEKVISSGVTGINFAEAAMINKSLSYLGSCISKLAAQNGPGPKSYINYRDCILTWILKESLSGNSKTYVIATLSPAITHYNESLSTLRFAQNAKRIVNRVSINEKSNNDIIADLNAEIKRLNEELSTLNATRAQPNSQDQTGAQDLEKKFHDFTAQLNSSLKERDRYAKTWEEKEAEYLQKIAGYESRANAVLPIAAPVDPRLDEIITRQLAANARTDAAHEEILKLNIANKKLACDLAAREKIIAQLMSERSVLTKHIQQLKASRGASPQ